MNFNIPLYAIDGRGSFNHGQKQMIKNLSTTKSESHKPEEEKVACGSEIRIPIAFIELEPSGLSKLYALDVDIETLTPMSEENFGFCRYIGPIQHVEREYRTITLEGDKRRTYQFLIISNPDNTVTELSLVEKAKEGLKTLKTALTLKHLQTLSPDTESKEPNDLRTYSLYQGETPTKQVPTASKINSKSLHEFYQNHRKVFSLVL